MRYLSHLAARALHQLPTVRPRLPTHFELMRTGPVETNVRAPLEYATFMPSTPTALDRAPTMPSPVMPPREIPMTPPIAPIAQLTPSFVPSNSPREKDVARREPDHSTDIINQPTERPPLTVIERTTILESIERVPSALLVFPLAGATPRTETIDHTQVIERVETPEPHFVNQAAGPLVPRVGPIAPKVVPYVPPQPEDTAVAEPAPIIHVSIGRIEVRAVHTPAPAVPPAADKLRPPLSLDDYLRGGRR